MDIVIGLFFCLLGFGVLILILLLSREIAQQKRNPKKYKNRSSNNKKKQSSFSPKIAYLYSKLLIRVAGDREVVERLISYLRAKHPGEKEVWYWEKAIYDLERDRRP